MATKKKPSAKQLAARAKFAAMARARAKAAKGKKTITKKTTTKKIGSLLSVHKPFFKKISKATAKKRFIENMEVYGLYDDGSESLIESLNDLDNRGIYAYGYEIKSGKMGKTTKSRKTPARKKPATTSRHVDTKSHNVKINVLSGMPKSSNKMYVRIDDLGYIYTDAGILKNYLKENANKWVEVDTSYLFDNQYNTIDGYRIYDTMINAIKNDARKGNKQFENNNRCCFLIWKGIKPNVLPFNDSTDKIAKKTKITWKNPTYQIGTYEFESNFLKHYRLQNARQRIKFLYWDKTYFLTDGIGYRATKSLTGGWPISYTIPDNVKNKVNQILNTL